MIKTIPESSIALVTPEEIRAYRKTFLFIFNRTGNHQESARLASLSKTTTCKCGLVFHKKPKETYAEWDKRKYHSIQCAGIFKRADKIETDKIIRMYDVEGKSLSEVGREIGVSHGCIKQRLEYSGIKIRPTRRTYKDFEIVGKIQFLSGLQKNGSSVQKGLHAWGIVQ